MSRLVVVTGVASGIGAAVRTRLRERGDRTLGVDLEEAEICADLGASAGRQAALDAIHELSGGVVDGLVTCAGLAEPSRALPRVNFFGTTVIANGLRAALAASAAPRVVLVGSISGTQPIDRALVDALLAGDEEAADRLTETAMAEGRPEQIYPSSKSAVAQWARRTAVAPGWADAGIAVNVVAPGVVLTPMSAELLRDAQMKQLMDAAVPMPLHGYSAPEDVARFITFLASDSLTHVTGQVIYADGGAEATLRPAGHF